MTDNALKVSPSLYCLTTSISHGVEIISPGCGVRASLMLFLSRVGHLGPTLDTVMGFFESFFMNCGRFEWELIAVFGLF